MTETRPTREELEAKAKALHLYTIYQAGKDIRTWDDVRADIVAAMEWAAREARENAVEQCAKMADAHYIPGHSVAGRNWSHVLAEKIRAAFKPEEPDGK